MSKILGQLYFERQSNGNLEGRFSNNHTFETSIETAIITLDNISSPFEGEYDTTWRENDIVYNAKLTIRPKNSANTIYYLQWVGERIAFWGEAFLINDNTIIGHYRNFQINP